MPSEIHLTSEMNKARKKNKPNNNKLSQQSKSQPPNNNNKKNNKSQRRRKTNSLNSKKLWRSSVWLKLPKVIRRKREPKKSKRPDNKQPNNNLLQKPNQPINQNNPQLKTSQSISTFLLIIQIKTLGNHQAKGQEARAKEERQAQRRLSRPQGQRRKIS